MMFQALKNYLKMSPDADVWAGPGGDVIAVHGPDGRFERLSEGARELFGMAPSVLIGRRLMDVIAPAHQDRLLKALAEVANPAGQGRSRFEARIRIGDVIGPYVEMALSRAPRGGLRSVTRDIEDRIAREEAIREESRQAAQLVAQRGEQLANVSHEIRTPLNALIGYAEIISTETFGPMQNERYKDCAKVIHDSGHHLSSLVSDLLDLSKAEANETSLNLTPESPTEIVEFCAEIMKLRAEQAGLFIHVDIEEGLGQVMLDVKIVRQILLNLLSNALKFTESGGISVTVRRDGAVLAMSVVDTGIGMSPDELSLVGQRFKQARLEGVRGAKGSGIGLSLSKALARVHGGELKLMSSVGEGTTALLRLPFQPAPDAEASFPSNVTSLSDLRRA